MLLASVALCSVVFLSSVACYSPFFRAGCLSGFPSRIFPNKGFFLRWVFPWVMCAITQNVLYCAVPRSGYSHVVVSFCVVVVVTSKKVDGVHSRPHRIDVNACIEGDVSMLGYVPGAKNGVLLF